MDISHYRYISEQDTDQKYLERYAHAYKILVTMPNDNRFSIISFGRPAETECGTAACIAGHAALHPWFIDQGFSMIPADNGGFRRLTGTGGRDPVYMSCVFFGFTHPNGMGVRTLIGHPFDPDFEFYKGHPSFGDPDAAEAADALRSYMEYHWGGIEVSLAIEKADSVYSAEAVHKATNNWNYTNGDT